MINGINYITDENGAKKAILLDLIQFKKDGTGAERIFEALSELQSMINEAGNDKKTLNTWEMAKEKLKGLKSSEE
jgi:glutamate synthase domain-containing protein 3